ncbi:MAG TPA: cyclic nucleotide-binding domain-containing protein [Planctomicrobium sp.]|nr:cyclic nucleotide-binding domain-containing protein [Planctomicrobium sp.]
MQECTPADTLTKFDSVLERCPLLVGFTQGELQACLRLVTFEAFKAGEEILTEGKMYHGLWILLTGTCEVLKHGQRLDSRLAVLDPGHVFGEMSFLHPVPHSASVRAVDHVETIRLMADDYEQLRLEHPSAAHKIAVNVIRIVSDRLRRMDEWTAELVERNNNGHERKEWQEFRTKLYTNLFE